MNNKSLQNAKKLKFDEFYTQREDIEEELKHYKEHFKNKIIYCNCDDPYESEFFKYFSVQFNILGLKKIIATSYVKSPISYTELTLFDEQKENNIYSLEREREREETLQNWNYWSKRL